MIDTINWLIRIEKLAKDDYSKAATYFSNIRPLAEFLRQSAKDEIWHHDIMIQAKNFIIQKPIKDSTVFIDQQTKQKIEAEFELINKKIDDQTLTEEDILESIVKLEYSEWNDIFLYVVGKLKSQIITFKPIAIELQHHLRYIDKYIEESPYQKKLQSIIHSLPSVWTENILIVDDDQIVSELIRNILNREGNIDIVSNGNDGLKLLENKYYKLIISDIDMPVMDGISFYEKAIKLYPTIRNKFLFISGDMNTQRQQYFKKNNLLFLEKPFKIKDIRNEAKNILLTS